MRGAAEAAQESGNSVGAVDELSVALAALKADKKNPKQYVAVGQLYEKIDRWGDACKAYIAGIDAVGTNEELIVMLIHASKQFECGDVTIEAEMREAARSCSERLPRCYACGFRGVQLRRCDNCAMVEYCSEDCQRHHWQEEHGAKCAALRTARDANAALAGDRRAAAFEAPYFGSLAEVASWDAYRAIGGAPGGEVRYALTVAAAIARFFPDLATGRHMAWRDAPLVSTDTPVGAEPERAFRVHILADEEEVWLALCAQLAPIPWPEHIRFDFVGPHAPARLPGDPRRVSTSPRVLPSRWVEGSTLTLHTEQVRYHEYAKRPDFLAPDLVVAFQPKIHEVVYAWQPLTLRALIALDVPTVFTAHTKAEHMRAAEILAGGCFVSQSVSYDPRGVDTSVTANF